MPKTILLIDNEPDIIKTVGFRLRKLGYTVHTAVDGAEGLSRALELKPDLIITDFFLPKLDGLRLCQHVKADQACKNIPVIICSGSVMDDAPPEGAEVADAYLPKPFDDDQFVATVRRLLKEKS